MKYVELKANLKKELKNAYLICGDDRYLCYDALKKIEDSANITIKDMNYVVMSGESASAREIVECANVFPFGDVNRLVVVKNFAPTKDKLAFETVQGYLNAPLTSTILVFFNSDEADFFKGMKNLELVDCSKIDAKMIAAFIKNQLAKAEINSNEDVVELIIRYCSSDMARITNELEKLIALVYDTKVLTEDIVKNNIVQDKEFQVFQLAEFIAKGDSKNALELVDSFMVKAGQGFTVLMPLYNTYRRALYAAINKDKTNQELANIFGVKEFAVKMLSNQIKVFGSKGLKQIVDMIADYDRKIKVGEMKENIAIKTLVFNILNLRGN